jgi:YD repeat-containing protein
MLKGVGSERGRFLVLTTVVTNLTNVDCAVSPDLHLRYDGVNRLTNVVNAVGTTKFTYTDAGQLLSEGGPWADDTITYSHTARRRSGLTMQQPNQPAWEQAYQYDGIVKWSVLGIDN